MTKTKASHHLPTNRNAPPEAKATWPSSASGILLATEVKRSNLAETVKDRLVREILDHEITHGHCTKTFERKLKKQLS